MPARGGGRPPRRSAGRCRDGYAAAAVRLNHISLGVTDIERAVEFYDRLGLIQIVAAHPRYARFRAPDGDATLSLESIEGPALAPQASAVYFECEQLDERVAELEAGGIAFDQRPTDQPYLWRDAVLRDPDGNRIHLYWAGESRLDPPWRV